MVMEDRRAFRDTAAEPYGIKGMHQGMKVEGHRASSIASDVSLLLLQELDRTDRLILILHHERGLEVPEISKVLFRDASEIEARLEVIEAQVLRLADSVPRNQEPSLTVS